MPERQEMEFIIRTDGTVEEHVSGVTGPNCEALTEGLEGALGDVIQRERTGDYFKSREADDVSIQAGS